MKAGQGWAAWPGPWRLSAGDNTTQIPLLGLVFSECREEAACSSWFRPETPDGVVQSPLWAGAQVASGAPL